MLMKRDWLNLLFAGQQLVDRLQDIESLESFLLLSTEWQQKLSEFLESNNLNLDQQELLLDMVEQVRVAAEKRCNETHRLQEELMTAHHVSRKYIQSS
jgi:hypothetical protein